MKLRIVVLIVLLFVGLTANGLAALLEPMPGTPAVIFDNAIPASITFGGGGIGFSFSPDSDMLIDQLGFFDDYENGIVGEHFVGVYDALGNQLASANVTTSDPLDSFFRYAKILEPLKLNVGNTYYILADPGEDKYVYETENFSWNGITYRGDLQFFGTLGGGLVLDKDALLEGYYMDQGLDGIFGPNFRYTAVPIPSGIWLLGSGLLFLVGRKKSTTFFS